MVAVDNPDATIKALLAGCDSLVVEEETGSGVGRPNPSRLAKSRNGMTSSPEAGAAFDAVVAAAAAALTARPLPLTSRLRLKLNGLSPNSKSGNEGTEGTSNRGEVYAFENDAVKAAKGSAGGEGGDAIRGEGEREVDATGGAAAAAAAAAEPFASDVDDSFDELPSGAVVGAEDKLGDDGVDGAGELPDEVEWPLTIAAADEAVAAAAASFAADWPFEPAAFALDRDDGLAGRG